ncbi:hypothetical protein P4S72_00860 [Vibrio sp. PP-XX7]
MYPSRWPVGVVEKSLHPERSAEIIRGTLADVAEKMHAAHVRATAMIIVSKVFANDDFVDSKLYDPTFSHACRQATVVAPDGEENANE